MRIKLPFLTLISGIVAFGCGNSGSVVQPDPTERIREFVAMTPRVDGEAELAALYLSKELVAPESLYSEMKEALRLIRANYWTDNSQFREFKFYHRWGERGVFVPLNAGGVEAYRAGQHHDIDSITELLNGEVYDTLDYEPFHPFFPLPDTAALGVSILFPGYLNIDSVVTMFQTLPTVGVLLHPHSYLPQLRNFYPWRLDDGRLSFLFADEWVGGDDPCNCNHYWYFRTGSNEVEFVGEFMDSLYNPKPAWWEEAKVGKDKYFGL